ncbi:MAG: TatD family hydrolase [Methylomonas sp.]|nr:TatD family hydrolase [Methylomonas sp.]
MQADCDLIDIHCHKPHSKGALQIVSLDTHQIGYPICAWATMPPPFPATLNSSGYFSLGLHPWFLQSQDLAAALQILEAYCEHPKLLAIGECGLDKCIATPLALQSEVFQHQIELAERWRKPLIIHCVKTFDELIRIKGSVASSQAWILHGYNRHPQLAQQLLKQGCYLSMGKALLQTDSKAALTLKTLPLDRLFLETDDAKELPISAIYAAAAKITGLTVDALRQRISSNFNNVFLR